MKSICVFFVALLWISNAYAALSFSNTLGDNMVLQRAPLSANVYGWADAGATITVSFNSKNYTSSAGTDGSWLVTLPPTTAGGPYTIAAASSSGEKASLSNVLFGDVYICGGQSNMQFTVASAYNATENIQLANKYPNIRVISVGQNTYSSDPLPQLKTLAMPWSVASSATIGAGNWSEFSAVCWFTGKDIYDQYQVPIGLISSNWGGTVIQAWSSAVALKTCNITDQNTGNEADSVLYNAMIVPFLKMIIKGALWYQGEQNSGDPTDYACMFPAMIQDWRTNFAGAHNFPFFFVQLGTWEAGVSVAETRQAQLAALALPSVGFATAADLGDWTSPFGSIHPRDKETVAERLTLAARNIAYGESTVVWQGPMFQSATVSVSGSTATVSVAWKLFGTGGLALTPATCPTGAPASICSNWAILLSDNVWHEVNQSSTNANTVNVAIALPTGSKVQGVRYGFSAWPLMTLYSVQGLPAIPFQYLFPN